MGVGRDRRHSADFAGDALVRPGGQTQLRHRNRAKGVLVVSVAATGKLAPTNQVDVGSEVSGLVSKVLVDVNDRVTRANRSRSSIRSVFRIRSTRAAPSSIQASLRWRRRRRRLPSRARSWRGCRKSVACRRGGCRPRPKWSRPLPIATGPSPMSARLRPMSAPRAPHCHQSV